MDYVEFDLRLKLIELTKKDFATLMGIGAKTVTNYASGKVPRHFAAIVILCCELRKAGLDFRKPLAEVGKMARIKRGRQRHLFE